MVYVVYMKYFFVVILIVLLTGCTFHIKAEKLDFEGKPVEPGVKFSTQVYELTSIDVLKKEI